MAEAQKRRRAKGTGGIFPVRDGVWRVDVEAPREPGAPRRRLSRRVRGSRTEAEAWLAEMRAGHVDDRVALNVLVPSSIADGLLERAAASGRPLAEELRVALAAWVKEA